MAKRKKKSKARKAKVGTFREAMRALGGVGVSKKEFGQFNEDGTPNIDREALEELKTKLGESTWRKVRFVALNAPFKRRSPISPA